jgi:pyruvate,water dikinase
VVASERNPYARLGVSIYRLIANLRALPENIRAFQEHLDATLLPLEENDLSRERPEELMRLYFMLQDSLLKRWRVPILNDFYTMIFFGLLKRVIEKWKLDDAGTLHNDLLSGEGGIISALRRAER